MSKLIVIEGTDCSGKETQTKLLIDKLKEKNIKCVRINFPAYDSPTGKIIGGPYLGKESICEGWFDEGAPNVDPKVSSLYYGADFLYHFKEMKEMLENGTIIILDRYFYSSFAHQGGKEKDENKRYQLYKWLEKLFLELLGLKDPDIKIFLHMPYDVSLKLKKNREESLDQNEKSKDHLILAEKAYKEIADMYRFKTFECSRDGEPKGINEISDEIFDYIYKKL